MTGFAAADAAWSNEHHAIVRVLKVERTEHGPVTARYTIMLRGGKTIANFPGYSLRAPTRVELHAVFGEVPANG